MTSQNPLLLLGTLGALSAAAAGSAVAAADTSQWKCTSCPYEQGASGTVDLGVRAVSDDSARFGDYTGLYRQGGYLIAGANARYRGADGLYGILTVADLTRDAVSLAAEAGREGQFALRIGYDEIPRYLTDTAATPFSGNGGALLSLPAGFPAATTGAMPLAATLQPVELAYKRSRLGLGAKWLGVDNWVFGLDARHTVRDGTQRSAGSFFATAAQLVAPLDQTTDELDASASYAGRNWQATLAYHASIFRNAQESLTWANPFTAAVAGSNSGQLALAPDNQFHQLRASFGYRFSPASQASADIALGRMTQDAAYLASTLNTSLVVPGLPAQSLQGSADTLNASLRFTTAPSENWRLHASLTRDERDNETPVASYVPVATDMFVGAPRTNQPYSFTQDRLKLSADYRGPGTVKLLFGAEYDARERTLQEVDTTRETTLFGRLAMQPLENLSVALKLAHADRNLSDYNNVAWINPAENPLLRKYNMAERVRDTAGLRADLTVTENVTIGFDVDWSEDDYSQSTIGLTEGKSLGVGGDLSVALSDATQLQLFGHSDRIRSSQAGSQQYGPPDWVASNRDESDVLGIGLRHVAIKDKLDLGADLSFTRSRSEVKVETGALTPAFPAATTTLDRLKLFATYRMRADLSLTASYWFERYESQDWRLDGVAPDTIPNLLAFGEQSPRYRVNVFSLVARYSF